MIGPSGATRVARDADNRRLPLYFQVMAQSNNKTAAGISTSNPNDASWRILDSLPAIVRRVIHEAPVAINPASAARLLDDYGYSPSETAEALQDACQTELSAFARDYRKAQGCDLPHIAAGATALRYQAAFQLSPASSSRATA